MEKEIEKKGFPVVETGEVRWHVAPGSEERFSAWVSKNWPKVLSEPELWLKRGTRAITGMSDGLVAKAYRLPKRTLSPVNRSRQSKVKSMFRTAFRLQAQGVKIPTPIAWSNDRVPGKPIQGVLVTEHMEGPLLPTLLDRRKSHPGLFEQLGALVGTFHANNYSNRDLKGSNILIVESSSGPAPFSVDLDGIRSLPPLPIALKRSIMRKDFIPLLLSLAVYVWNQPEIREHIARGWSLATGMELAPHELPQVVSQAQSRIDSYSAIEMRPSRDASRRVTIHAPVFRKELLLYPLKGKKIIESSKDATVCHGSLPGQCGLYRFKRFETNLPFRDIFRSAPVLQACHAAHRLAQVGLDTPPIIAAIESRINGLRVASELITEVIEEEVPLDAFFADGHFDSCSRSQQRQILEMIGATVGHLHQAGLVHGNLQPSNLLCRMDAECNGFKLLFTGNERVRPSQRLRERARDLATLNTLPTDLLSMRDRFRFWRSYRQASKLDTSKARQLLHWVT